ncbi:right-handed parallel beta-helix repeat-containing protein [Wenzhouxiangella marina]|uniref:right-handed parallel beta-helix repeat-containing protein n=1 Tax=Wenzhouxiangella marina TaxID=1579979 RepID=UPI00146FFC7D|nr:right-handed parallel beta-helix repeat-containing protein [Wenzhouxiangella marina]MBB6086407.1 hypothetical protein [Wenzhouxiangella marina]
MRKVATFLVFYCLLGNALALEFIVTSTADSGPGSLREAIGLANLSPEEDQILLDVDSVILSGGGIEITAPVTVLGTRGRTVISGGGNAQIFRVLASAGSVVLEDLVLRDGTATGDPDFLCESPTSYGGAICANASVEIVNSIFETNQSESSGGALYVRQGNLVLSETIFRNNTAEAGGGGGAIHFVGYPVVFPGPSFELNITRSHFEGNSTLAGSGDGGALSLEGGLVEIRDSIFFGNAALNLVNPDFPEGGAISTSSSEVVFSNLIVESNEVSNGSGGGIAIGGGNALIRDTTVSNNVSDFAGGGIRANFNESLEIVNSTVSNNTSRLSSGGGIATNNAFSVDLYNSTVTENTSLVEGGAGGLSLTAAQPSFPVTSLVDIQSSILSGNMGSGPDFERNSFGFNRVLVDSRHNLLGSGLMPDDNDVVSLDPQLGPLQDNGCAVPAGFPGMARCVDTHLPLPTSPSLAVGLNPLNLPFDQRGAGFPRQIGSPSTIGALTVPSGFADETIPVSLLSSPALLAFLVLGLMLISGQEFVRRPAS